VSLSVIAIDLYQRFTIGAVAVITRGGGGSGGGHSSGGGGSGGGRSSGGGISSGGSFGGSGSGGAVGGLLFVLIFGGIAALVIVLLVAYALKKRGSGGGGGGAGAAVGAPTMGSTSGLRLGDDPKAGAVTTAASLAEGLAEITAHDPAFDATAFVSGCERAFFVVQKAWSDREPGLSRQVMHDGIWQQHKFQIEQYVSSQRRNMLDNLAVQNAVVVALDSDTSYDSATLRFFASCADYDIDVSNDKHKVVRGNKAISEWAEDWLFQRSSTAVTKPGAGTLNQKCPNCGAPLDLDLAGSCKYCKAPVMSGQFDWVLVRIEQLPSWEYAESTLPT
jgi:hypothetical protein